MRHPLILSAIAGLVSATGFAPLGLWPVTLAAFALLLHLVAEAPNLKRALLIGWLFGVGHFTVGLNWIAHAFVYQDAMPHWFGYGAVVVLSLYLAVYPAAAAGLAWRWGRGHTVGFALIYAAAWIVTEWLRATMFTGFAWNPLGVALVRLPFAQSSEWVGTYGLSTLAVLLAGTLLALVRRNVGEAAQMAMPAALAHVFGTLTLFFDQDAPSRGPLVRVVQPNIGQEDKYDSALDALNFRKHVVRTGPPSSEPRLILWPEAAVPEFLDEDGFARSDLASLLGPRDILLTGATKRHRQRRRVGDAIEEFTVGARNNTYAIDARGRLLHRYDKAHLVPYGEYLPMRPILSAIGLQRLVPGDIDFWPGSGPLTYELPNFGKVGVQICYEIVFSGDVAQDGNRPDFIYNPSNDAWFGSWGPPQHLAQARLRAIEEGLPVVRSTPTGISAVIDSDGRLLATVPLGQAGFIETRLPSPHAPTPFSRFGNILAFIFASILAGIGVALRRRAR